MFNFQHPDHNVPDEILSSLGNFHDAELATMARQDRIAQLARPNEEERRLIADIRESAAQDGCMSSEMLQTLRDVRSRIFRRLRDEINVSDAIRMPFDLHPWDTELSVPDHTDPTFWWARTEWWHSNRNPAEPDEDSSASFRADLRKDGLHFFGGVTTHDGDLYKDVFGAVAVFELQPERIPQSSAGLWRSTPHVELFGTLLGYTGDDDIFTGDLWSKCWMHRSQQIFQWGFGQNGPVPIVLGQADEHQSLIFEENAERTVHVGLPGFQWMPPVTFGGINIANSLWARLEVRFDIQTEGAGSLLWLDPEVLLRTFQWPLTPL